MREIIQENMEFYRGLWRRLFPKPEQDWTHRGRFTWKEIEPDVWGWFE